MQAEQQLERCMQYLQLVAVNHQVTVTVEKGCKFLLVGRNLTSISHFLIQYVANNGKNGLHKSSIWST